MACELYSYPHENLSSFLSRYTSLYEEVKSEGMSGSKVNKHNRPGEQSK